MMLHSGSSDTSENLNNNVSDNGNSVGYGNGFASLNVLTI